MSYRIISLNGDDYIIVDTININNVEYIYAINDTEGNDYCTLLRRTIENGILMVESVQDEAEMRMVFETMNQGNI